MRRASLLSRRGRWFSSSSGAEARSAGTEGAPKKGWSRYALVGIPLVVLGVVVTDIVCNVNHRKALEKRLPTFVSLVREHYGFDDEDVQELSRVKMVKSENRKPVDAVIKLRDGTVVRLQGVDGTKSVQELLKEAVPQAESEPDWGHLDLLAGVEFTAPAVESSGDAEPESPLGTADTTLQPPSGGAAVENGISLSQGTWGMLRSFSEIIPDTDDSPIPTRSSSFGVTARPGERTPAQALLRFENACADVAEGLRNYAAYGTLLPVYVGDSQGQARQRPRSGYAGAGVLQQKPQQQQKQKQPSEADLERARARKRVEDLERTIALLREEQRRGSSREVDVVEAEIRAKQQEIAELRRKHLNYFYYF